MQLQPVQIQSKQCCAYRCHHVYSQVIALFRAPEQALVTWLRGYVEPGTEDSTADLE